LAKFLVLDALDHAEIKLFGRGGADDYVIFSNSGDTDRIVGFNSAEDQVWSDIWFNSNGDPIANRNIKEVGGETVVTTTSFAGQVLHELHIDAVGLPPALFSPTFAVARVVGWLGHVAEQYRAHRLMRPRARYIGARPDAGPTAATPVGNRGGAWTR